VSIFYPLQITVDQAKRAKNIYAENRSLQRSVALLGAEVALLREQAAENARLRSMLGFEETVSIELIPVRVVARDPSPFSRGIVVDAGANKSVLTYMPVVGEKGVAGKVVQVMPGLSLVQLLNDPLNRTGIMVRHSRAVSILETENGADFFAHFRIHEEVAPGDTVVTSGLGGIYPKGLHVGVVDRVFDERDPLFKKVSVKPGIDPYRIEELFIVRLPPQWAAFREQIDSLTEQP
jgi:rod shape-determining protein MreC